MTERKRRKLAVASWRHRFNLRPAEKPTVRPGARFYVSVRDGARAGFLLGPYGSHLMALANVERGRKLAHANNDRAIWYAYGTASFPESRKTVFGR